MDFGKWPKEHGPGFAAGLIVGLLLLFATHHAKLPGGISNLACPQPSPSSDACEKRGPSMAEALPPPQYDVDMPEEFLADREGEVLVKWLPVDGAASYVLQVKDSRGKVVRTIKAKRTLYYLRDLEARKVHGETIYSVNLATMNFKGQIGSVGESRKIILSKVAGVVAPTIKVIKAED